MSSVAPTDQRASVRPISFLLESPNFTSDLVTLPIRPEDLTKNEPQRVNVNQTLGRSYSGWVDNYGGGIPSVTIAGHTGWRVQTGNTKDGFQSFEQLNDLVSKQYPTEKQKAIDAGIDPAKVKLLFIDVLDNFAWSVAPMQFTLRRSRSRPLLYQYNISLQAVDTSVQTQSVFTPLLANITAGLNALASGINNIAALKKDVQTALQTNQSLLGVANPIMAYINLSLGVLGAVQSVVSSVNGVIAGTAGQVIGVAKSVSMVGVQVFRTIAAIQGVSTNAKIAMMAMAAAFNEMVCLFSGSLKPRTSYQNYEPLFGASNCSSTAGGRPASVLFSADTNVMNLVSQASTLPVTTNTISAQSQNALISSDPILAPLSTAEIGRHLDNILSGTVVK